MNQHPPAGSFCLPLGYPPLPMQHLRGSMPEETEDAVSGSICEVHELYKSLPDERGRILWTDKKPENPIAPAENSLTGKYALVVRKADCYDGKKSFQLHSVVVQSPLLKTFLASVMAGYPGVTLTLNRVEFEHPFKPFVHRWEALSQALEAEQDPKTLEHAKLLHKVLDEELQDLIYRKKDLVNSNVITQDLLWALFEPGTTILSTMDGSPSAFKFEFGDYDGSGNFRITSQHIDWDGHQFGYSIKSLSIPAFDGTSPIMELPVLPLIYHDNEDCIRKDLIARGRLWEEYKGYHYMQYNGPARGYSELLEREMTMHVHGRIMIDTEAYSIFEPQADISMPRKIDGALTDDQRLIATPILRGYALKEKSWLRFFVENVKEITWDEQAFDSLVLPNGQQDFKRLILGLARAKSRKNDSFDDVIQGKGRGVIMLLRGPPGVGKTLTAESVAEAMKVPLYILSAGDLGTNSDIVERKLRDILSMVPRWGAIILLDEADVFMEARDTADLKRNELVSIFLRLLEYYEGILFLTTNRAEHIDPAFESRIHVSIRYPELTAESRRLIWRQFISSKNLQPFSDDELDHLCNHDLNGRQIKNILTTACLLAQEEDSGMKYEHVEAILNLRSWENREDAIV